MILIFCFNQRSGLNPLQLLCCISLISSASLADLRVLLIFFLSFIASRPIFVVNHSAATCERLADLVRHVAARNEPAHVTYEIVVLPGPERP
jgi:hypothetical protein